MNKLKYLIINDLPQPVGAIIIPLFSFDLIKSLNDSTSSSCQLLSIGSSTLLYFFI